MQRNRKVLWIAAIAFSALSVTGFTAEGDSPMGKTTPPSESAGAGARPGDDMHGSVGSASNPPSFSQADVSGDGLLDRQETIAIGIPFSMLDTDNDGNVTREEYLTGTALYAGAHDSQTELR